MSDKNVRFNRRDFLRFSSRVAGALIVNPILGACQKLGLIEATETPFPSSTPTIEHSSTSTPTVALSTQSAPAVPDGNAGIAFVRTRDRGEGVRRAISLLGENRVSGKKVFLKPNFNSDDPAPASTHPDTLRAMVTSLQEMGAGSITVADRSGMGETHRVMENLGVYDLGNELGFDTLAFDELTDPEDWVLLQNDGDHWKNGYPVPRQLLEAEAIVQTCCLKPHRFGGHFTLSLKNTVGMVGKFMGSGGHNYMTELHTTLSQRLMIAEANSFYQPALVVLDGVEAFTDKGPDKGTKVFGDVIMAGTDRVALDAVGLALLRFLGYAGKASRGAIFAQDQIARAVELGLGIDGPDKITFLTDDSESAAYAAQIHEGMRLSG
jgi:uncharacterized protein (DUF362 family)